MSTRQRILILDFGSQYTQLIARRVREAHVYCEIRPSFRGVGDGGTEGLVGIILSGGPASVYESDAPTLHPSVLQAGVPILGVCYGMQLLCHTLGGEVEASSHREFGPAGLDVDPSSPLFAGLADGTHRVWMSHGDRVTRLPDGFVGTAMSGASPYAAMQSADARIHGVQFHPEVAHSDPGPEVLRNFLFRICLCAPSWTMLSFIDEKVAAIRAAVGDQQVILGLSGGVDSTVVAALLDRAIGERCTAIFVDNGLLRAGEYEEVGALFRDFGSLRFRPVDASERFLSELAGVDDPERKRKIIGRVFVEVFEAEARSVEGASFLAQGTLYPDVVESHSVRGGPSVTIKSHHNVGGLPEKMALKLLEPLRELFKDEVRELGLALGLPRDRVFRHPFPGPGLAVRVLGPVSKERCDVLRHADRIFLEELHRSGHYDRIWQAFAVLLPVRSVGVMGDGRTYEDVCALRAVTSTDGMTADWYDMPRDVLARVSSRIINEVRGINRVVYDVSSKPPATIEWE